MNGSPRALPRRQNSPCAPHGSAPSQARSCSPPTHRQPPEVQSSTVSGMALQRLFARFIWPAVPLGRSLPLALQGDDAPDASTHLDLPGIAGEPANGCRVLVMPTAPVAIARGPLVCSDHDPGTSGVGGWAGRAHGNPGARLLSSAGLRHPAGRGRGPRSMAAVVTWGVRLGLCSILFRHVHCGWTVLTVPYAARLRLPLLPRCCDMFESRSQGVPG